MTRKLDRKGKEGIQKVNLTAITGEILNVPCFRGFAKLCDLAAISSDDPMRLVDDSENRVAGVQRVLIRSHAKGAYQYAKSSQTSKAPHLWPEIILNVREEDGIKFSHRAKAKGGASIVKILVDVGKLHYKGDVTNRISISRVDGNHRLHFAYGKKGYEPLEVYSPFCITRGLTLEEELGIFNTINEMQKGVSSSTRDTQTAILMESDRLHEAKPALWFVEELVKDHESPFYDRVDIGVQKERGSSYPIKRTSLRAAIDRMLSICREMLLKQKGIDRQTQYKIVRNYWIAVASTWEKEWNESRFKKSAREYFLWTASPGIYALGSLGGYVITLLFSEYDFEVSAFNRFTEQVRNRYPRLWEAKPDGKANPDLSLGGEKGANTFYTKIKAAVDDYVEEERARKPIKL